MTHVSTSPYCPQSNDKVERWQGTLESTTIRPASPSTPGEARRLVAEVVTTYSEERLHSALGYVTPRAKMQGRECVVFEQRDARLEAARERRRFARNSGWLETAGDERLEPRAHAGGSRHPSPRGRRSFRRVRGSRAAWRRGSPREALTRTHACGPLERVMGERPI